MSGSNDEEPVELVLVNERKETETLLGYFDSWSAACEAAEKRVAEEPCLWKHVFHTAWWNVDGVQRINVRPRDAESVKF